MSVASGSDNQWHLKLSSCLKGNDDEAGVRTVGSSERATTNTIRSRWLNEWLLPVSLSQDRWWSTDTQEELDTSHRTLWWDPKINSDGLRTGHGPTGDVARTNWRWQVRRTSSDTCNSGLARKATTMKTSSEQSACWRGQQRVLSGRGERMIGSYLYPSVQRGSEQVIPNKNLTWPKGRRGDTQQSTVTGE